MLIMPSRKPKIVIRNEHVVEEVDVQVVVKVEVDVDADAVEINHPAMDTMQLSVVWRGEIEMIVVLPKAVDVVEKLQ